MYQRIIGAIIAASILVCVVLNILLWQSAWMGVVLGALWLAGVALLAGSLFGAHTTSERVSLGLLIAVTLIILAGSSSFYLGRFTDFHIALIALCIPSVLLSIDGIREDSLMKEWLMRRGTKARRHEGKLILTRILRWFHANWFSLVLVAVYVGLYAFAIITILNNQTVGAIRSPWEVVPRTILLVYFLATFILFLLFYLNERRGRGYISARGLTEQVSVSKGKLGVEANRDGAEGMRVPQKEMEASPVSSFLLCLHFFLSFSLALLVYSIGFGFDPFIHRATENLLAENGTIMPKPYLYIGQYTLVVFLSKLLSLPTGLIDTWLLPVLASIFIPSIVIFSLKKTFQLTAYSVRLTALSLLILPVYFIVTIPQPFANLLYLILIILSFPYLSGRRVPLSLLWGIGIAIFFIHALTGIPALLYLFLLTILSRPAFRLRPFVLLLAPIVGAVAAPGLVALGNALNGSGNQTASVSLSLPALAPRYLPFLSLAHTAELWHRALPALFLAAALIGTRLLWKHGRQGLTVVPWLTALSLAGSYFLVRTVNLSAIIAYERAEFTERILELIGITILPFFAYCLVPLWQKTHDAPRKYYFSAIVAAALITIGWYYAYPRVDAFAKSRGFSVSQEDTDAVYWIETNSRGAPYIVLANQSVSAAVLQEFGFKRYFSTPEGITFYYPIPTSSPLYQYYLDMVYQEASRETMLNAMELAGVKRAYFVLNDYWLDADKIAARAQTDADAHTAIGSTRIFTYIINP